MLGHAMWLASGRASKKDIREFYEQMGWSVRRRVKRKVQKRRRKICKST